MFSTEWRNHFQPCTSRRGFEGLPRRNHRQGGCGAPAGDASDVVADSEWACGNHGGDVVAAIVGFGNLAGILAENAAAV